MADPRVFLATLDNGNKVWLSLRNPTMQEREAANTQYSRVFGKAIREGVMTLGAMNRALREHGTRTDADDRRLEDLRIAAVRAEQAVNEAAAGLAADAMEELRQARRRARSAFYAENTEVRQFMENTADGLADEAARSFLKACTVECAMKDASGQPVPAVGRFKPGSRVWASVEAMLNETDRSLMARVEHEYVMFINNMPSDWDTMMAPSETIEPKADVPAAAQGAAPATA